MITGVNEWESFCTQTIVTKTKCVGMSRFSDLIDLFLFNYQNGVKILNKFC